MKILLKDNKLYKNNLFKALRYDLLKINLLKINDNLVFLSSFLSSPDGFKLLML